VVLIVWSRTRPRSSDARAWAERTGGAAQLTQPIELPPPPVTPTSANLLRTLDVAQTAVQLANITPTQHETDKLMR
jgi:hypothetical protein